VGSAENKYGNAFYASKKKYSTVGESIADYNGGTSRTWDISNTNKLHPYSKKFPSYKLVSRDVPEFLPKEGGLAWKRAGFARNAMHVTKCQSFFISPHRFLPLMLNNENNDRCRRPTLPSRPPRASNLRQPLSRSPGMD
jgi:hypothetical protein